MIVLLVGLCNSERLLRSDIDCRSVITRLETRPSLLLPSIYFEDEAAASTSTLCFRWSFFFTLSICILFYNYTTIHSSIRDPRELFAVVIAHDIHGSSFSSVKFSLVSSSTLSIYLNPHLHLRVCITMQSIPVHQQLCSEVNWPFVSPLGRRWSFQLNTNALESIQEYNFQL